MNTTPARTAAVADAAAPIPSRRSVTATRVATRTRPGHALVMVIAAVVAATTLLAGAPPAHAASYRDIKSVAYGLCLYAYGDPLEDIYLKRCTTQPAKYGNWAVTLVGYHNNHQLWVLRRQSGACLGVDGNATYNYLYSTCDATRNVWEVFATSGRYVFKSFSAFQYWHIHTCLTFNGRMGGARPQLGACSLTSTADQIYK